MGSTDFLIVVALEEERDAILALLPRHEQVPATARDPRIYYTANLAALHNRAYALVVAPLIKMGPKEAIAGTKDAITRWAPGAVILVGIAAGLKEGIQLGDIVVATHVIDYEPAKMAQRLEARDETYPCASRLIQAVKEYRSTAWIDRIKVPRPNSSRPVRVPPGEIASGAKVIAQKRYLGPLLHRHPRLIALEMEAAGCAYACETVSPRRDFIMIKAVSDFASKTKGTREVERWRPYACSAAAAFAIGLIRSGLLPPRRRPRALGRVDGRRLLLTREAGTAKGRVISRLLALGFAEDESKTLADSLLGDPLPADVTASTSSVRLIIGDFGAGKSLIAEKLHLIAIRRARQTTTARIPVFLDPARLKSDSVQAAVQQAAEGLGSISNAGVHLVVDGLDEMGPDHAFDVLQQARVLVNTWPGSRIWLTSRPLERFLRVPEQLQLPLLDESAAASLAARAARGSPTAVLSGVSPDVRETLRRPLFALLYGLHLRNRPLDLPRSEAGMLHAIVKAAIGDRSEFWDAPAALAVLSIDRGGGAVPVGDVERSVADRLRQGHRLVVERDGCFVFAVPLLAHWFGAQAIRYKLLDVSSLLSAASRVESWKEALALFISDASAAEADDVMTTIAHHSPGLGGLLIREAVPSWGFRSDLAAPPWLDAGQRLRRAMTAWASGLGQLAGQIAPLRPDGSVDTIAVRSRNAWLTTQWIKDGNTAVVELDDEPFVGRSARPGASAGWSWRWTIEDLASRLKKYLEHVPLTAALAHEATWDLGRLLRQYGSLYTGEIDFELVTTFLPQVSAPLLRLEDVVFDLRLIRQWVTKARTGNRKATLQSPYPGPDLQGGNWVWSAYSLQRLLERTRSIYTVALRAYEELTGGVFATLAPWLAKAQALPAVLHGRLIPRSGASFRGEPELVTWFEPLPAGSKTVLDFEIALPGFRRPNLDEMWTEVKRVRPRLPR